MRPHQASLALLVPAGVLAVAVIVEPGPLPGELAAVRRAQSWPEPFPTAADWVWTVTSTEAALLALIAPAAWLFHRYRWHGAIAVAVAVLTMLVVQPVLKELVDRPRPTVEQVDVRAEHSSMSFPSGHSMSTSTVWAAAALLALGLHKRWLAVLLCVPIVLTGDRELGARRALAVGRRGRNPARGERCDRDRHDRTSTISGDVSENRGMDFDMPGADDPRRLAVRAWLSEHPDPSNADLHAAGYIAPHWPPPFGIDADPLHQLIIDDELRAGGVGRTSVTTNAIGVGWAAPTIYMAGSEWQKQRFLDPIFRGDEFWCQLFSEPDAGSDLAGLATRAVRDGDEYVVNGSKIWTSGGHLAQFGILIARTDPELPKHKGLSYFIVPMDLPGITLSPIVDMTTAHSFNQTFFDNVRLPAKYRVGEEGDGWRLAKVTLANERVSLSSSGSLWGTGPSAADLLRLVREAGGLSDPDDRQRAASLHIEAEVLRLNRLRTLTRPTAGPHSRRRGVDPEDHG